MAHGNNQIPCHVPIPCTAYSWRDLRLDKTVPFYYRHPSEKEREFKSKPWHPFSNKMKLILWSGLLWWNSWWWRSSSSSTSRHTTVIMGGPRGQEPKPNNFAPTFTRHPRPSKQQKSTTIRDEGGIHRKDLFGGWSNSLHLWRSTRLILLLGS